VSKGVCGMCGKPLDICRAGACPWGSSAHPVWVESGRYSDWAECQIGKRGVEDCSDCPYGHNFQAICTEDYCSSKEVVVLEYSYSSVEIVL